MKITEQLERALEDGLRASHALPAALHAMRDAMAGAPGAQGYDAIGARTRTVLYCERHEKDLTDCDPDALCTGVPVPTHTDPTGEAASSPDPARDAQRQARRLVAHLHRTTAQLVDLVAEWQPGKAPNAADRKATEQANRREGCEVCARSGKAVAALVNGSDVGGKLERSYRLCRWHYDFVRDFDQLPHATQEREYQRTGKLKLRQTQRLTNGLKTGTLNGVSSA